MRVLVKQPNAISDKTLAGTLRSLPMAADQKLALRQARTAWWLKTVRETDPRGTTLSQAAVAAGLSPKSGSVVSHWENNDAVTGPKLRQLERLAEFYRVPLTLFTEPPETDQERAARYRQLALEALDEEREDWEAGSDPAPGDEPGDAPLRRLA